MPRDTRVTRAKKVIRDAQYAAENAEAICRSRSTGTRAAYKIKATAAERALEILSERPPRA
jgi:hypothetical protein